MVDAARVAQIIRDTAARVTLARFRALAPDQIRAKTGPADLVTVADVETEEALTARLRAECPGSVVVGEEAVGRDPRVLDQLHGDAPVWIVDPIDGTLNFANGDPGFGTIVALAERGQTVAGWIHLPVADVTVHAVLGGGAWCGGRRLRIAPSRPLSRLTGAAYGTVPPVGSDALAAIDGSGRIGGVYRPVSSAVEFVRLACGETVFLYDEVSQPWDHAAGVLILEEAGGMAAFLDGTPYSPCLMHRPILTAAKTRIWQRLHRILLP